MGPFAGPPLTPAGGIRLRSSLDGSTLAASVPTYAVRAVVVLAGSPRVVCAGGTRRSADANMLAGSTSGGDAQARPSNRDETNPLILGARLAAPNMRSSLRLSCEVRSVDGLEHPRLSGCAVSRRLGNPRALGAVPPPSWPAGHGHSTSRGERSNRRNCRPPIRADSTLGITAPYPRGQASPHVQRAAVAANPRFRRIRSAVSPMREGQRPGEGRGVRQPLEGGDRVS